MTETLYRKSWQPLAEADKSARQVVRSRLSEQVIVVVQYQDGAWRFPDHCPIPTNGHLFLCLEPVEVVT